MYGFKLLKNIFKQKVFFQLSLDYMIRKDWPIYFYFIYSFNFEKSVLSVVSIRRFELSHHTCKLYNLIYTNSSTKNSSSSSLWSWSLASSETKGFNLSKDMMVVDGPHEETGLPDPCKPFFLPIIKIGKIVVDNWCLHFSLSPTH